VRIPVLIVATFLAIGQSNLKPDPPHKCGDCKTWNKEVPAARVFGNTYFVGTAGLSSVLVVSNAGLILLDGGLPQTAPIIDANIRTLGFKTDDVKLILNSHAHYDHAGGIAALQRASGATVVSREPGKRALERGEPTPDDPQFAFGRPANGYAAARNVRAVADGETLRLGDVAITAHAVPGHTPGATTWTWKSCEGPRCLDVVYADSLNAVSADGFRFTGDKTHPSLIPAMRKSIDVVRKLPCDVIISVHPTRPFIKPGGCRAYADGAEKRLEARIAEERTSR
jgi:metallo-beta-lactamase class B